MLTVSAILECQFGLTQKKRLVVFYSAFQLLNVRKKWIKGTVLFCVRTFKMLVVAFGGSTMSRTQNQLWYNRFKEGLRRCH